MGDCCLMPSFDFDYYDTSRRSSCYMYNNVIYHQDVVSMGLSAGNGFKTDAVRCQFGRYNCRKINRYWNHITITSGYEIISIFFSFLVCSGQQY